MPPAIAFAVPLKSTSTSVSYRSAKLSVSQPPDWKWKFCRYTAAALHAFLRLGPHRLHGVFGAHGWLANH